jgi:TRAP-type mannitol/chloroaromatic compound transport system permease small subunit
VIEATNERVGRAVAWLMILLVLNTFLVAVLRYGFSLAWVGLQEAYVWMHGLIFMVASGYTFLHEGHVRVDVIYRQVGLRTQAWINILGTLILLWPALAVIWSVAYPYVLLSWERLETSREAGGLPGLYLWKTSMLIFVALLALQGLALVLRSILVLSGRSEWGQLKAEQIGT